MEGSSEEVPFAGIDALNHLPLDALKHPRRREVLFALPGSGPQDGSAMGLVAFDDDRKRKAPPEVGRHSPVEAGEVRIHRLEPRVSPKPSTALTSHP